METDPDRINSAGLLTACHECDVLQYVQPVPEGATVHCVNCGAHLYHNPRGGADFPLAIMLFCSILFVLAIYYPLLTLDISGRSETVSLLDASMGLYRERMPALSIIVLFTTVLAPGLVIAASLYIFFSLRQGLSLPGVFWLLKGFSHIPPWGMMDVFMLGILVTMVKLADMADLHIGIGFYAFAILSVGFAIAAINIDTRLLWEQYAKNR